MVKAVGMENIKIAYDRDTIEIEVYARHRERFRIGNKRAGRMVEKEEGRAKKQIHSLEKTTNWEIVVGEKENGCGGKHYTQRERERERERDLHVSTDCTRAFVKNCELRSMVEQSCHCNSLFLSSTQHIHPVLL